MVNRKRIPLERMLNKTESAMPLLYDSALIIPKRFMSQEVDEQCFFIAESKISSSKIVVQIQNQFSCKHLLLYLCRLCTTLQLKTW